MNANKKYTGLERTPPSMAWLIRKRSIVQGQIDRLEKQLQQAPKQIESLRAKALALDIVIPMHVVAVDTSAIKGTRPTSQAALPRGMVTRGILECLRLANGAPRSSLEISMHVANIAQVPLTKKSNIPTSVKYRLKNLASQGKVVRHHDLQTADYGIWTLAPALLED